MMRIYLVFAFLIMPVAGLAQTQAKPERPAASEWIAPAVRPPSGLIADPGDRTVYLEWNAGLEERLAGYHVYRQDVGAGFRRVTLKPAANAEFVDTGLSNGRASKYYVTAVLANGIESGRSNVIEVVPRPVTAPQITEGATEINVAGYERARVAKGLAVTFENGNRIVFDKDLARIRDWQTAEGLHLLYPLPYGNPIDLTEMDDMGFPVAQEATEARPALPPPINLNYSERRRQLAPWWVGYKVAGNRVTFQYRIPLSGPGVPQGTDWDLWIWASVWETWSPVERALPGRAVYSGLARRIELEFPPYYKDGFSLCLNDGFGVNGSAGQAVTYELQWPERGGAHFKETHWQKGADEKGVGRVRLTRGFHPSNEAVQVSPFLFASFPQGTLLLAPRRYYYSTTYSWRNYAAQGKDGLWPNYTVDYAGSGRRTAIETFEYLWNSGASLPPPQQFMDASFHFRRALADLYTLPRNLTALDYAWGYWGPGAKALAGKSPAEALDVLKQWGHETAAKARESGADQVGGAHELWTSSPYTVPDTIRLNPAHPINRAIAETIASFTKQGMRFGYWVRPEFVKQALPNVTAPHFYTPYYGYVQQLFPSGTGLVEKDGLRLIREHPEWIRLTRKGEHPMRTPYNWTPMSLTAPGWYEEVVYKQLVMMRKLGMTSFLQDGGFANLAGVDYTGGKARPVQPYYWRLYQDAARLGIDVNGECMIGWGNNTLGGFSPEDVKYLWAYVHAAYTPGAAGRQNPAELRHRSHQLYVGSFLRLGAPGVEAKAARFAQDFVKKNGHPDRVFLEGLKWDQAAQQWTWDNVWWEYAGGRRVRYPNFTEAIGE